MHDPASASRFWVQVLLAPVVIALTGGVLAFLQQRTEGNLNQELESLKQDTALKIASSTEETRAQIAAAAPPAMCAKANRRCRTKQGTPHHRLRRTPVTWCCQPR